MDAIGKSAGSIAPDERSNMKRKVETDSLVGVVSDSALLYKNMDPANVSRMEKETSLPRKEKFRLRLDQRMLKKHLRGPDVLDFPIGTGRLLPFTKRHFNVYGFDICAPYVDKAKQAFPEIADHFEVHVMERVTSARRFDSVYSLRVTGHIDDLSAAARSISGLLKPEGRWIFNIAPHHPGFSRLDAIFAANGLRAVAREKYDSYFNCGRLTGASARLFGRWMQLVELFPMPFWLYRLVDRLFLSRSHAVLVVAEKSEPRGRLEASA